ncbi:extracellular solute-binding protein [Paenibacillus sp. HWE-109]|uniref:ABC transporter substrate-binding protein n=1 Tax=Paenibacillus sp. HWE-109 TaxID=1306526 RepID=UPI001EDDD0CE|nr:extracellular solute-binding protein [Paenibacillus sp. HWE-109]UKS28785.1 extracellular solute-binding protein [Paenibacillus sp. HWE-109]
MKARRMSSLLVSLVLSLGLVACSTSAPAPEKPAEKSGKQEEAAKTEPIKLMFWGGVPEDAGPKEVVETWNKANPDIQVEYVRYVNDDAGNLKLDTALLTGQQIDLFATYLLPRLEQRTKAGYTLNLSEFKDYDIDKMMGPAAADWKINDKYYALPTKFIKELFFLNKDALDKAGLPVPYEWTWEDVREYSTKLKAQNKWGLVQDTGTGYHVASLDGSLVAQGYTKADGTSNFDNPYIKTYLQMLHDMMHTDKTTPTLAEQISTKMPVEATFLKGEAFMFNGGNYAFRFTNNLKDYPRNFKIALAPPPKGVNKDQKDFKVFSGLGDAISINAKTAHKEAAWKFLKWYADGGMLPMAKGGRLPSSKAVNREQVLKLLLGDAKDTYDVPSLEKTLYHEMPSYVPKLNQQIVDMRREEYEKYLINKQPLNQTIDNMVKRHNEYLKNAK